MREANDSPTVTRRTVLEKGAIASGIAVLGGTALAGSATGSPLVNFAYVPDDHTSDTNDDGEEDTVDGAVATLVSKEGTKKINCNDAGANIKTAVWEVDVEKGPSADETWYFIPNSYEEGDVVEITGNAIDCQSMEAGHLTEVEVTLQG